MRLIDVTILQLFWFIVGFVGFSFIKRAIDKYLSWKYWRKLGYRHVEVTCHHCKRKTKDFRNAEKYGLEDQCMSCTTSRDPRCVYSDKIGGYIGVAGFPGEEYVTTPGPYYGKKLH